MTGHLSRHVALVTVAALVATPLSAQQSDVEASLRALRAVLVVTLKAPSQSARMHFAYQLELRSACAAELTSRWKTGRVERRTVTDVDFAVLSPDAEIQRSDSLVIVSVHTSSGRPDLHRRVTRGAVGKTEEGADKLQFVLWEQSLADSLAHHLADAVRACGGQPRSEEAVRMAAARRDSLAAAIEARALAPEARAEAIEACRLVIREKLREPQGAEFDQEPFVHRSETDATVMVSGKVLDRKGDKRAEKRYTCTLARRGARYQSLNAVLY